MPAQTLFAESTTLTGSIGVYVALPNVEKLGDKVGFRMITIKAGAIKDSGSPFKEMTPEERRVWQDTVDESYLRFLQVVVDGRKDQKLTQDKLLERFRVTPLRPDPKARPDEPATPYTRYRADGGTFSGTKARDLQLVDKVGTLDDAIAAAASAASLGEDYRAVKYQRPKALAELLFGARGQQQGPSGNLRPEGLAASPERLGAALAPRIWYLAPGYEAAGMLAAAE
jgi:protease-4